PYRAWRRFRARPTASPPRPPTPAFRRRAPRSARPRLSSPDFQEDVLVVLSFRVEGKSPDAAVVAAFRADAPDLERILRHAAPDPAAEGILELKDFPGRPVADGDSQQPELRPMAPMSQIRAQDLVRGAAGDRVGAAAELGVDASEQFPRLGPRAVVRVVQLLHGPRERLEGVRLHEPAGEAEAPQRFLRVRPDADQLQRDGAARLDEQRSQGHEIQEDAMAPPRKFPVQDLQLSVELLEIGAGQPPGLDHRDELAEPGLHVLDVVEVARKPAGVREQLEGLARPSAFGEEAGLADGQPRD